MAEFRLAHLSDTHVVRDGVVLANGVDSNKALRTLVNRLLNDDDIDAVLISGDLVDKGELYEYFALRKILDPLRMKKPVFLMLGNHDSRANFVGVFSDYPGMKNINRSWGVQYAVSLDSGCVLLVLDSLVDGQDHGYLGSEKLAWLEQMLARHAGNSVIVAVHHPVIDVGNTLMNQMNLRNANALLEKLAAHSDVTLLLCGHLHRHLEGKFGARCVQVGPSVAYSYASDVDERNISMLCHEAPGFLVHHVSGSGNVNTEVHTLPLFVPPIPAQALQAADVERNAA